MSDETQKTCPRCGRKKEDFAVAWGWSCCYQRLLGQDEPELEEKAGVSILRTQKLRGWRAVVII